MTRVTNDVVLIKHIGGQLSVFIGWFIQARFSVGCFVYRTLRDQKKVTILQFERRGVPAEWHNAPRPVHTPAEVPLHKVLYGTTFPGTLFSLSPFAEVVGGHEYNHSRIEMHVAKPILYFESDARAVCSRIHSNVAEIGNVCCDVVNSRFGGVRRDRHSELVRRKGIVRTHNSMDT